MILAREAALRHTGEDDHLPFPSTWCHTYEKLTRDVDNYSILMSHFTRQHNVEPQDIRTYLGVGTEYEELC